MKRHATASLILLATALICLGIDHKRAIEEQYKGKVFYISHVPGLYGIWAVVAYEHTYHVTANGAVKFEKVWQWPLTPNALLPQGTQVEIRSVKVKDDRIEMTIRTLKPVSLGLGLTEGAELEVNLRLDVGKDAIKSGDIAAIQKSVSMLISADAPKVNIQVGMKLEEVTAQLGEPEQQIQVENKQVLVYPHLTVVMEESRVVEVKVK